MKRIFIISLLFCVSSAALLAQSVQPITNEDIFFFEYLFTSVSALSGTPQLDHVQHFKLTDSEAEVLIKFAVAFKSQEATLTQQAKYAGQQASVLAQIRLQRNQLLQDTVVNFMQQLGSDGAARLTDRIAKIRAAMGKAVRP